MYSDEDCDLYQIHALEKAKRRQRYLKAHQKQQKLHKELTHYPHRRFYIYVICEDIDFITRKYVYRNYISYSKNRDIQQFFKKQASRKIRHLRFNNPVNGNQYRKYYNYHDKIYNL